MTKLAWTVAALLCATAVDRPALGRPETAPVQTIQTATLRHYVDDITTVEGIGQTSAMTVLHRRHNGKAHLTG